jgi:hypothetical protein
MTSHRRVPATALVALFLVAACGGGPSPAATPTPAATEPPAAATEAPAETPQPVATDTPVGPGAAADLEAMLPAEVAGVAFERASFDYAAYPGEIPIGGGDDDFSAFLAANGKSVDDLRIAVATPIGAEAGGTMVMAIQVRGVAQDKLAEFALADMTDAERTTIGGKEVYGGAAAGFGAYVYLKDDIIFYVLVMGGQDLTEGMISQLP